jgi:CRP/FNR family transcriptional regulator, anaerobic regulatory protein
MEDLMAIAAALPAFADTPSALLAPVAPRVRRLAFAPGDRIHHDGDTCDRVAFVLEGELRVAKAGPAGREIELYRVAPGEPCVLELSAAMGRSGYPARAVATVGGRALTIPADALLDLLAVDPGVQRFVFGLLSRRLASVMQLVEEVAFRRMDERLVAFLRREARGEPPVVALTHDAIAERLGTVREVVSRLLSHLAQAGEVELARGEVRLTGLATSPP